MNVFLKFWVSHNVSQERMTTDLAVTCIVFIPRVIKKCVSQGRFTLETENRVPEEGSTGARLEGRGYRS